MTHSASSDLFTRAQQVTPSGVNSPVRAFGSVGGTPPFITSASGAMLHDADGPVGTAAQSLLVRER